MKFAWNCTLNFCVFCWGGCFFWQSCGIILWKWSAHRGLKIAISVAVLFFPSNSTTWISVCQFHKLVYQNDCLKIRDLQNLTPMLHGILHSRIFLKDLDFERHWSVDFGKYRSDFYQFQQFVDITRALDIFHDPRCWFCLLRVALRCSSPRREIGCTWNQSTTASCIDPWTKMGYSKI